jgi:hypothetical protein
MRADLTGRAALLEPSEAVAHLALGLARLGQSTGDRKHRASHAGSQEGRDVDPARHAIDHSSDHANPASMLSNRVFNKTKRCTFSLCNLKSLKLLRCFRLRSELPKCGQQSVWGMGNDKIYSRATTFRVTFGDALFTLKSLCELWLSLLEVRPLWMEREGKSFN